MKILLKMSFKAFRKKPVLSTSAKSLRLAVKPLLSSDAAVLIEVAAVTDFRPRFSQRFV